jgi:hypothetical protein
MSFINQIGRIMCSWKALLRLINNFITYFLRERLDYSHRTSVQLSNSTEAHLRAD